MGLVILIVVGVLLGWLTTIILKIEDGREIGLSIAAAVAGTVVLGVIAARGSFLGGISPYALIWGAFGAISATLMLRAVRRRFAR